MAFAPPNLNNCRHGACIPRQQVLDRPILQLLDDESSTASATHGFRLKPLFARGPGRPPASAPVEEEDDDNMEYEEEDDDADEEEGK